MKSLLIPRLYSLGLAVSLLSGAAIAAGLNPASIEARQEELKSISQELKQWKGQTGPRINSAIHLVPEFLKAHLAVQKLPLTASERKGLLDAGISALPESKASVFQAAAPAMGEMKQKLKEYFEAYDKYMDAEIRLRTFGAVLQAKERFEALGEFLSDSQSNKLVEKFTKLEVEEEEYRRYLADPEAKNHHISNNSDDVFFAADALDDLLLKYERKYGLAEKRGFGVKVGNFFRAVKRKARVGRIYASTLPAIGRMFTYLYNPFRKKSDPGKVSKLLRFFSQSYRWAAGMKMEVRGADNIPTDAPVVFAFSHRSTIEDAVTMMAVVPNEYSFMVAQRAIPAFLNDKLVNEPSIINVGGKNADGSKVGAIESGVDSLKQGINLAIFPEGTTPTPTKETRPLRHGIDVVTSTVADQPVYIVPVTIDDPAAGVADGVSNLSHKEKVQITVTFGAAIDPLKLKSVPGAGGDLLLDVIRAYWHRNLYRPDVKLLPAQASEEEIGVVPDARAGQFQKLHEAN